METKYDAIIIGSGPGGMACAALLARAGLRTLVLEKNAVLGGKMVTVSRDGHTYDLWPHGQVPMRGSAFEALFRELGVEPELLPCLTPEDPREVCSISYRARGWKDYRTIRTAQARQDATPFFDLWGLAEDERLKAMRFLTNMVMMPPDEVDRLDDVTMHDFLSQHDIPYALYSYLAFHSNASLAEPVDRVAASEQIKIMQQIALQGGGGNYKGGFGHLIDVLAREYKRLGGEILTRARAERIIVEDGRVAGVISGGQRFDAPVVVSSAGLQPTVLKLVGEEHFDPAYVRYVRNLQPGWGFTSGRYFLKRAVLDLPMYVVYSDDSWWDTARYQAVREGHVPDEVILFAVVPSNYDPEMSPPGKQVLVAGTICPPDPESREIEALYRKMDEMLARLFPEAWAAVERAEYGGPREVSSSTRDSVVPGAGGECVGLASMVGQCGKHKPSPEAPIPGLYFAGPDAGSAGMGTHMAADSGMRVAQMVVERLQRIEEGG